MIFCDGNWNSSLGVQRVLDVIEHELSRYLNQPDRRAEGPPLAPDLAAGEVHIWAGSLDGQGTRLEELAQWLDAEESAQAERFAFEELRTRFIARRGLLRIILDAYSSVAGEKLTFCRGEFGKPELIPSQNSRNLHFSVSHSQGMALFALSRGSAVGIDLEAVRPLSDLDSMIERCLSSKEKSELIHLPFEQRQSGFFKLWTCKEAIVKASGEGLSRPLESIELSFSAGFSPAPAANEGELATSAPWFVRSFSPWPGYFAAIASSSDPARISFFQF